MQEKLEVHANLSPFSITATCSIQKEHKNSFFPHTRPMEPTGGCTHGRFSDILKWDFNHPDICWESNTASCKHSRRLLVLMEVKKMVKGVEIGGSLGCSNHELLGWLSS